MGLDSVELLIDIEKHFNISIADEEAAQTSTVEAVVTCVFEKIKLNPDQKCKSQVVFYKLRSHFKDNLQISEHDVILTKKINQLVPIADLQKTWADIERSLDVKLPPLSKLDLDPTLNKTITLLGLKFWTRTKPVTDGTIRDLIEWVLSLNHHKLIDPKNLRDREDIERAIIGIVHESTGVPIDEIRLKNSLTNDLGID